MTILTTEEDFARHQRSLCPDLPDNIVLDELARLKCLETGKLIMGGTQMTRMMIRAASKMSAAEKQKVREQIRWKIYDPKLRPTIN